MNVVLDTNIFISGIFWKGDPYKILLLWKDCKLQIVTSIEILQELSKTLSDFKIQLKGELKKEWIELIMKNSILVSPIKKLKVVKNDPTDDKFIEAAITGNAEYIITNDKHLLKIIIYQDIRIVKPKEFLQIFRE